MRQPKRKLILVSDIHGLKKSEWLKNYIEVFEPEFEVVHYCSLELANINPYQTKEEIHVQFVNGGLETAAQNLMKQETESVTIVAFSIGGVIAWKAALLGLPVDCLYAVSSTRLRKETQKPEGELKLIFGAEDAHQPDETWYQNMEIIPRILDDEGHDLYQKPDFIKQFASQINWANGIIY